MLRGEASGAEWMCSLAEPAPNMRRSVGLKPLMMTALSRINAKLNSCRHRGLCNSRDSLLHALPVFVPQFCPQSVFCPLPVPLSLCQLSLTGLRETEQALPPVLSGPHPNPALLQQEAQRPRQCRTVHGKTGAQPLLIRFSSRSQRCKQAKLGDLESGLPQFLVIDPRYNPRDAPQVLTRAGQIKKRICRVSLKSFWSHSVCIYICHCSFKLRNSHEADAPFKPPLA
jgi:hypothetical protein